VNVGILDRVGVQTKRKLVRVARCTAALGGSECTSAVFYDWGLQVLENRDTFSVFGDTIERFNGFTQHGYNVKICARCTTPYILEGGELYDISDELSAEDVAAIIRRGQTSLPHPYIKDP
jgi:hypothetical protein